MDKNQKEYLKKKNQKTQTMIYLINFEFKFMQSIKKHIKADQAINFLIKMEKNQMILIKKQLYVL